MKHEQRVVACVDQSGFADCVADHAAWAAMRLALPLEFLHVIDRHPETATARDRSGAIGIDAQAQLLAELSSADEALSRSAREQGRIFLDRLRERAVAAGIESPDVRQRYGHLVQTLVEQEGGVQLFVLGRRGESAQTTQRDLGRNLESVVRSLHKPILTVTEQFREPRRALIAFDGGAPARRGVQLVAASPLFKGLPVHLLMAGADRQDRAQQLERARATLEAAGFEARAWQVPGDAERVIARFVVEQDIDILVMGAYSHSPLRSLFVGSRTSDLLRSARIPTLLLR